MNPKREQARISPLLYNTLQSPGLGYLRSHVREDAIIDSYHEELTGETKPSHKSDGRMLNLQSLISIKRDAI